MWHQIHKVPVIGDALTAGENVLKVVETEAPKVLQGASSVVQSVEGTLARDVPKVADSVTTAAEGLGNIAPLNCYRSWVVFPKVQISTLHAKSCA